MPISIACPQCQAKYRLPDEHQGKAVKCKQCGRVFKVTGPAAAAPVPAKVTPRRVAAGGASTRQEDFSRFGLDGPIQKSAGLFDDVGSISPNDPLGNHVVQDPGFDMERLQSNQPRSSTADDEFGELTSNPAIARKKKKQKVDPLEVYLQNDEFGGGGLKALELPPDVQMVLTGRQQLIGSFIGSVIISLVVIVAAVIMQYVLEVKEVSLSAWVMLFVAGISILGCVYYFYSSYWNMVSVLYPKEVKKYLIGQLVPGWNLVLVFKVLGEAKKFLVGKVPKKKK